MAAYSGKQRAILLYLTLRHASSQHTCCRPAPAPAVVPLSSMLEELSAANPRQLTHSWVGGGHKLGSY